MTRATRTRYALTAAAVVVLGLAALWAWRKGA